MKHNQIMAALLATGMLHTSVIAADVSGTVEDRHNHPIPNAIVKIKGTDQEVRTNNKGIFNLDLDAGKYTLEVLSSGSRILHEHEITIDESTGNVVIKLPYDMSNVITINADPLQNSKLDLSKPVVIVSGEKLLMNRATTLGEILEKQPGMSVSSFGPAVSRPVIRGLEGPRVLMTQNQMTTQDASVTSNDHDVAVEPLLAERIEVLKGPATLLYGGGAIGGVVNVVDNTINPLGADGVEGALELRQGDSATGEETIIGTLTAGDESYVFNINGFTTETDSIEIPGFAESIYQMEAEEEEEHDHDDDHDDHDDHDEEEEVFGFLENSQSKSEGLSIGSTWINDWGYIGAALNHSNKTYGISGHHHHHEEEHEGHDEDHDEHEEEEEGDVILDMEYTRADIQASLNSPFDGISNWFIALTDTDYEHTELEGDETGTRYATQAREFKTYMTHEAINGFEGVIGLQYTDRDFSAVGDEAFVPPSITETLALFIVEEKQFDNFKLELGARFEGQSITVERFSEANDSTMSFSAGLVYDLNETDRLAVNLSSSERAPGAEELFTFGEHIATQTFDVGDLSLDVEQSLNIDVSYRFESGRFNGEVNAYMNSFSDFIYAQNMENTGFATNQFGQLIAIDDDLPLVMYQQQDADFTGLEFHLEMDLVEESAGYELRLGLMGDVIDAELGDGERVPRVPPNKTGVYLHYDNHSVTAELSYTSYGDVDDPGLNELPTDGFDMVDFEIGYSVPDQRNELTVFLKAKNLLDEEARDHSSFLKDLAPRTGRSLVLGARYQF